MKFPRQAIPVMLAALIGCQTPPTAPRPAPPPKLASTRQARAQHILVAYAGARGAAEAVTRGRDEAQARARELRETLREGGGAGFDRLARESSDAPSAADDGQLGVLEEGRMTRAFEEALFALAVGDISDVVETPFGFHIIRRLAIEEAAALGILIQFALAPHAPAELQRTREQARAQAHALHARAAGPEADFAELARAHSDGPSAADGGFLGIFLRGAAPAYFDEALFALKVGEVSEVIESDLGFFIVKRVSVERARARHLLIAFTGAERAPEGLTRSRDQARELIEGIRVAVTQGGADFAEQARKLSDDPYREAGGDLGRFARGQMVPVFERAVFALQVGEVSSIVETPLGFHLLQRTE